jgi:glucose-6-phosphate 1-dehydrogenase
VVRGRYTAGSLQGASVPGYREEAGVSPTSNTETFVALRTEIANWRWAGVPFYIRTGKRLAGRDAHIAVNFRPVPHPIFRTPTGAANRLLINLQPKDGLELQLLSQSASQNQTEPTLAQVSLDLDFEQRSMPLPAG